MRVGRSYSRTCRGVNAEETMRRRRVCSGGSVSSIDRLASRASSSRSQRLMWPTADENVRESFETVTTSSYFVIAQKPPVSHSHGCQ